MYSEFRTKLMSISDDEYRDFCRKGIPCDRPFLGVRIPEIRKIVSEISPEDFGEFIAVKPLAIEEVIARGFLIARLPYEKMIEKFDSQIEFLDNWCTVDTFCAALRKVVKRHEANFLEQKVEGLLKSDNEFSVRTGLVCLLDYYVNPDYLHLIFDRAESLKGHKEYYVRMALAWLVAECFIKFPNETFEYLKQSGLDRWTFNKTISKICDSRRVEPEVKTEIKIMRK